VFMRRQQMNNSYRTLLILFLIGIFSISSVAPGYSENVEQEIHRILYLSSYSPSFETFFDQVNGIKTQLDLDQTNLDIEFMDTKRFYTEENLEHFYGNLKYKLSQLPDYDVVIVADDNGLEFVMDKRAELFNGVPIVFMGINNIENALTYSQDELVTGVVEAVSIDGTIKLALDLNPGATELVALVDDTPTGRVDLEMYQALQEDFPSLKFNTIDLAEVSFDVFATQLSKLDESSIILHLSAYKDYKQTVMTFDESLNFILSNVNQPVFHPYAHGIGSGLLGGQVVSHYEQGVQAGRLAKRILDGEDVKSIDVIEKSPNPYIIDYEVLKSSGYDESSLPDESVLINKPVNLFDQYKQLIISVCLGLSIQLIIIFILLLNIRKRKNAEAEILSKKIQLQTANEELSIFNEELGASNEELMATNEELTAAFDEIEDQKKHIYKLLYTDNLTNLDNRLSILNKLDDLLSSDNGQAFSILFLDVDNFKNINDTFGHDLGDEVIFETGKRLMALEDKNFRVGRFGGDEFLILIKGDKVVHMDRTINEIQECFEDVIYVEGNRFYLTISVGVAEYPNHGVTRKELIKKADMALYEAKNSGKNKYVIYQHEMGNEVEDKVRFQAHLKDAFNNDEFYLNYQPYYNPANEEIVGYEALIRWNSSTLGQVSPYKLITNAEEMGLIIEVGHWVFKEACLFAKRVNQRSTKPVIVSINISTVQLMYNNFFEDVTGFVEKMGIDPTLICLEMTETVILQSISAGQKLIEELKTYGFSIALDDFGTGYSSLSYLRNLPATALKIDKKFIDQLVEDSYDQYTVEAIIKLAHQLDLRVVAEGVETEDQLKILKDLSCDAIQGYLLSKPLGEMEALQCLNEPIKFVQTIS